MSLLDYNQIPGYRAAVNEEQANRELAFLPEPLPISGVPVRHMNARHWIRLTGCGNYFMAGGRPRTEDVAMMLWFLSPAYSVVPGAREKFIKETVAKLPFLPTVREIYAMLERTFQDCPSGNNSGHAKQYTAPIASIVDLFASEYGWTDEHTLEMPLARMFQMMRRIEMRLNPKAPQFNRSERHVSAWLADQNEHRRN